VILQRVADGAVVNACCPTSHGRQPCLAALEKLAPVEGWMQKRRIANGMGASRQIPPVCVSFASRSPAGLTLSVIAPIASLLRNAQ